MVNAIDLTSLLQMGVGLGIGLSFFRATLNRKVTNFNTRFDRVHAALSSPADENGRRLANDAVSIRIRFKRTAAVAETYAFAAQIAALGGALVNTWLLIRACLAADETWHPGWPIWWSVGFYVTLLIGVELLLFLQTCRIDSDLEVVERDAGVRTA
jgi:hypothetical protein